MPVQTLPESSFGNLARQMSRLSDQIKGFYGYCPGETWMPAVNLYENETDYVVCVDLAGIDKEKIDLSVVDNRLRIRGTRPVPSHPDLPEDARQGRWRVHLMEIDNGAFYREVELPPDIRRDRIKAAHRNGLLWIEIPKS
jgi:HSP20 family protein